MKELKKLKKGPGLLDGGGWGVQFHNKFDYETIDWQKEEAKFKRELMTKSLRIVDVGGDGNCLFRAIAY